MNVADRIQRLRQSSLAVILANQAPGGAYLASPNFRVYRFAWLRDGTFTAHAALIHGQEESARRFHAWAARTILRHARRAERAIAGEPDYLHTRYSLDGEESAEEWWNFQLDGYATWLWALGHLPSASMEMTEAAELVRRYLQATWRRPNYDLWEEFPEQVHTYTLAAVYGALGLGEIRDYVMEHCISGGHLTKFAGTDRVDASLIGAAVPYGLLSANDPLMRGTIARIQTELGNGLGLRRYAADTYFGGGDWPLLTAWLGWYFALAGDRDAARACLEYVATLADEFDHLPEQVLGESRHPQLHQHWLSRWGRVAKPLVWAHAKFLILDAALR